MTKDTIRKTVAALVLGAALTVPFAHVAGAQSVPSDCPSDPSDAPSDACTTTTTTSDSTSDTTPLPAVEDTSTGDLASTGGDSSVLLLGGLVAASAAVAVRKLARRT